MNENSIMKIVLVIVVLGMIYLFFRTNNENFADTPNLTLNSIKDEINKQYNLDIEAMRNLGAISKSLLTGTNYHNTTVGIPGQLTIPADLTTLSKDLLVNKDTTIVGNLTVNNNVSFLPKGCIIAFNGTVVPVGWRICDGGDGTPDLRNRFIYGSDQNNTRKTGGAATHTLTTAEMPSHNHTTTFNLDMSWRDWNFGGGGALHWIDGGGTTSNAGGNQPHNNMPPYFTLMYIMRVI